MALIRTAKDPDGGVFAHPAIFPITKEFCYNPRNGLARGNDDEFGPLFPLNYIALAFTAVSFTFNVVAYSNMTSSAD